MINWGELRPGLAIQITAVWDLGKHRVVEPNINNRITCQAFLGIVYDHATPTFA